MGHERIKILAIDDNQDNLISLKALVHEVFPEAVMRTALNGTSGFELATAESPDIILLDIVMPDMDGFEVCQKLKNDEKLLDIPVVFVTALKEDKGSRIRALECGAEAFLAKPIDETELTAQIRAMLKIRTANLEKRDEKKRLATLVAEQTAELRKTQIATLNLLEDLKNEIETRKISEAQRKQAEAEKAKLAGQLHQAQKIESVGQLAGGVAHDFNNMLGVILGHAEMALMKADPSSPFISDLQEISNAAQRSATLTRQLLTFARRQVIAPKVLILNEAVANTLNMLQRLIGENIQLSWNPAANPWPVKVDPSQIDQILANLCVNARDAIAGIGKISIKTANSTLSENAANALPYEAVPGDYVLLSVSDNGCGMDKQVQAHIFEPFYTTKEVGNGTGLGLSTVYGAVKQNNGFLTVYSEPGLGTVFNIYLPREKNALEAAPEATAKVFLRGTETILLVEDDEMLLRLVAAMLEESGYTVLSAATAELAQSFAREHPGPIHLLISDMIMPVMNGRTLATRLLPLRPEIKTLFLSGYTADIISDQGVLKEDINFLQKPFSFEVLTTKVREVLDNC